VTAWDDGLERIARGERVTLNLSDYTPGESDAEIAAAEARLRPQVAADWRERPGSARGLVTVLVIACLSVAAMWVLYEVGLAIAWLTTTVAP
jgi:hypothetical protein